MDFLESGKKHDFLDFFYEKNEYDRIEKLFI